MVLSLKAHQHKTSKMLRSCVPHREPQCIEARQRQQSTMTHKHTQTTLPARAGVVGRKDWTLKQACFQGYPESAVYVQVPIGSRNPAIHNAYHTLLCPSSLFEPRHRSLKVKWLERRTAKGCNAAHVNSAERERVTARFGGM